MKLEQAMKIIAIDRSILCTLCCVSDTGNPQQCLRSVYLSRREVDLRAPFGEAKQGLGSRARADRKVVQRTNQPKRV